MASIERFEDLVCWKEARVLSLSVYKETLKKPFGDDWGLRDQIRRSVASVMANIAEGFECSDQEFAKFLRYSLRSSLETKSHLYLALDLGYINQDTFDSLCEQIRKCVGLIKGFLKYLCKKKSES